MSNKMGIFLILFTIVGILGISAYYSRNTSVPPTDTTETLKGFEPYYYKEVLPSSPVPKKKGQKHEQPGALGGSSGGDFTYATPTPEPPLTALPNVEGSTLKKALPLSDLETQKFYVKAGFSAIVLIASLIIVFKGGSPESAKWAFGSVGTILGYWLK